MPPGRIGLSSFPFRKKCKGVFGLVGGFLCGGGSVFFFFKTHKHLTKQTDNKPTPTKNPNKPFSRSLGYYRFFWAFAAIHFSGNTAQRRMLEEAFLSETDPSTTSTSVLSLLRGRVEKADRD